MFWPRATMMDAKQLYVAAGHLTPLITWDDDWIHFGTGKEVKYEQINKLIDEFLTGDNLNIVHNRQNSGRNARDEIKARILELLGRENFQLWNESLTKVIDFNRIGVLRVGGSESNAASISIGRRTKKAC